MKKLTILLLFVSITKDLLSQTNLNQKIKIEEFKNAVNKQFTKITTGTGFSNMGNFASISSDSKSFSLAGNAISKGSVWGLELSGGATEGIFKLFNNEALNANFSGEIKYHKLLKTDFAARNSFEVSEVEDQVIELKNQFSKDSLAIANRKDIYKTQLEIISSESKRLETTKQIAKADSLLLIVPIANTTKDSLEVIKGNLVFELESLKLNIDNSKNQLAKVNNADYFSDELFKKEQQRDKQLIELRTKKKNIELQEIDITWLSFGVRAKNNEIKLFAPLNLPATQFSDTSFVSQRFSASISRYRVTSLQNRDFYWSAGIYLDYTTNFNSLKKVEIEERVPVAGNPQQAVKKTINAYQGNYEEGLVEFTLFYDYYKFLGQQNSAIGLHLNPTFNYTETVKKPLTNLLLGVIIPFSDKEKQTSKINVEVFYSRQDVFNYLHKETKSSSFGIRAALPITSINNKQ